MTLLFALDQKRNIGGYERGLSKRQNSNFDFVKPAVLAPATWEWQPEFCTFWLNCSPTKQDHISILSFWVKKNNVTRAFLLLSIVDNDGYDSQTLWHGRESHLRKRSRGSSAPTAPEIQNHSMPSTLSEAFSTIVWVWRWVKTGSSCRFGDVQHEDASQYTVSSLCRCYVIPILLFSVY
jgi:hypothetical protein